MKSPSIQDNKDAYDKDKKFSPKNTCPALDLTNIQDGSIGFHLQVPRWWHASEWSWKSAHIFWARISFLLQLVSFTVDGDGL